MENFRFLANFRFLTLITCQTFEALGPPRTSASILNVYYDTVLITVNGVKHINTDPDLSAEWHLNRTLDLLAS